MKQALELAQQVQHQGEVPVGAVLVREGTMIARGFNQRESSQKATDHAEMAVIDQGCQLLGGWRLDDCTMYVTLEPCLMCAGAILQARLKRLVYACANPKAGAVHSLYHVLEDPRLNHRVAVTKGVLQKESSQLLKAFFQQQRI